jgi:ABC-type amino acid transport substrate-binding protein
LYSSLTFGGDEEYINCILQHWNDEITLQEDAVCMTVSICVQEGSYHAETVSQKFPPANVITSVEGNFYEQYESDICNVVAGDQFQVSKNVMVNKVQKSFDNYTTTVDQIPMKNEPVSMITRKNDVTWSDFVNWVVNGLLYSEQKGYTLAEPLAQYYLEWDAFGDEYKRMFFFTYEVVGSFHALYERNLETFVTRQKINTANNNGTLGGVIYSVPFGNLSRSYGPEPLQNSTLYMIQNRTFLNCGVHNETIFASIIRNADGTYNYSGFDVDYCRALSAAIFDGDPDRVNYTDLTNTERFDALQMKRVDMLSRITTLTLVRDVSLKLTFSQPTFFDKIFFAGQKP